MPASSDLQAGAHLDCAQHEEFLKYEQQTATEYNRLRASTNPDSVMLAYLYDIACDAVTKRKSHIQNCSICIPNGSR